MFFLKFLEKHSIPNSTYKHQCIFVELLILYIQGHWCVPDMHIDNLQPCENIEGPICLFFVKNLYYQYQILDFFRNEI